MIDLPLPPVFPSLSRVRKAVSAFALSESGALRLIGTNALTHAGTITVNILADPLLTSPHARRYSVTGWTGFDTPGPTRVRDGRLHEIDYLWQRSGTPGVYTLPTRVPLVLRNRAVAYGPDVSWTFEPGTHTVSCLAVERSSGKTAYWEETFTVATRAATFPTSQTLYVSNVGDFSAAPAGAVTYTSLATAFNAAKGTSSPRCIMLRDGETHEITVNLDLNGGWWNFYMCRDGSGATRPTLNAGDGREILDRMDRMSRMQGPLGTTDLSFILDGVRMTGPYDSATQTGITADTYAIDMRTDNNLSTDGAPEFITIHNCFFSGFEIPFISTDNKPSMKFTCLSETEFTSCADYDIAYGELGESVAIIGCKAVEKPDAITGGPRDRRHNNHGNLRLEDVGNLIIDASDFFSIGGWVQNIPNVYTQQACIRVWTEGVRVTGTERASIRRCVLENGYQIVALSDKDASFSGRNVNAVIAQNYFIATHMTEVAIAVQYGGCTFENNTCIVPNTPNLSSIFIFARLVDLVGNGLTSPTQFDRTVVRHNTLVSYKTTTSNVPMLAQPNGTLQTDILVEHNLTHFPNGTPVSTPFAPLSIANTITPYMDGYRRQFERFTGSISAIPPGGFFDVNYSTGDVGGGTQTSYLAVGSFLASPLDTSPLNSQFVITLAFNATSVRVTNADTNTIPAGSFDLRLKRAAAALPANETIYATPATGIGPASPQSGSPAIGGAGTVYPRFDILGGNRRTIIDPLNREAASDGAVEVALES